MRTKRVVTVFSFIIAWLFFVTGTKILSDMNRRVTRSSEIQEHEYKIDRENTHEQISHRQSSLISEKPVNLLLLGLDDGGKRCDVVTLFNCNPTDGKINILSIPRDTKVYRKGNEMRFNALYGLGSEEQVIAEVSNMTGLTIDYYVTIDFAGFRKIIDTLEGVAIDVPIDMHYDDPLQNLHIHLSKGAQLLDGKKAEQYVRYRKGNNKMEGYNEGDIGRIKVQQDFIKAFIQQKFKLKYIAKADKIYNILKEHIKTNINISDITKYVSIATKLELDEVSAYSLPGEVEDVNWYLIFDKEKTKALINEHFFK